MTISDADLKKAAVLTPVELKLINDVGEKAATQELRPIVVIAMAAHLLDTVVRCSEGAMDKKVVVRLVRSLMQCDVEK